MIHVAEAFSVTVHVRITKNIRDHYYETCAFKSNVRKEFKKQTNKKNFC